MRNMIGSIIDYDPQITSYKNEVNRIINEIYLQFFTERAWQWAQKDIDQYTVPDITETNKRITTGAAGQRTFENGIELMSNTADQIITLLVCKRNNLQCRSWFDIFFLQLYRLVLLVN